MQTGLEAQTGNQLAVMLSLQPEEQLLGAQRNKHQLHCQQLKPNIFQQCTQQNKCCGTDLYFRNLKQNYQTHQQYSQTIKQPYKLHTIQNFTHAPSISTQHIILLEILSDLECLTWFMSICIRTLQIFLQRHYQGSCIKI